MGHHANHSLHKLLVCLPACYILTSKGLEGFPNPSLGGTIQLHVSKVRPSAAETLTVGFDVTAILRSDLSLNEEAWATAKPMLLTPYL